MCVASIVVVTVVSSPAEVASSAYIAGVVPASVTASLPVIIITGVPPVVIAVSLVVARVTSPASCASILTIYIPRSSIIVIIRPPSFSEPTSSPVATVASIVSSTVTSLVTIFSCRTVSLA